MNNIQLIVDVRSVPKSGYTPYFNKMNLINYLKRNNINYYIIEPKKSKKIKKKTRGSSYSKLSLFQKPDVKFFRPCPLSGKDAPVIDYKNIKLLRKYISESGRILPSRVTSVSLKKQKEVSKSIKRARLLALV